MLRARPPVPKSGTTTPTIWTDSANMTAAEDMDMPMPHMDKVPHMDKDSIYQTYKKSGKKESHGHAFYDGFRVGFAAAKNCEQIDMTIID